MDFKEKTAKQNYIYKGKILNLKKDDVILPDGNNAVREIVEHGGGSCVLCIKDDCVYLVKQFRYAYGEELWEIPAGKLNQGEDPKQTAIRELEEEAGLLATEVSLMYKIYPTPGYSNEIIWLYRADKFTQTQRHLDKDEFLTGEWVKLSTAQQMINDGRIKDGKTLIALLSVSKKD